MSKPASAGSSTIAILNFGSQYSMLIARRIREAKVYCEVLPHHTPAETIRELDPAGIILSGGPGSVYLPDAPRCDPSIFNLGIPLLGICYGMQLMACTLKGRVEKGRRSEYGRTLIKATQEELLFNRISLVPGEPFYGWMSHRDEVTTVPPGFQVLARTVNGSNAAMGDLKRHLYGLQFHPEVSHTQKGSSIIHSFLFKICRCTPGWTPENFIEKALEHIQSTVGKEGKVVCALSGGVDSSVVAFLLDLALKERVVSVFVDHGLLREKESRQIADTFAHRFSGTFIHVDARQRFLRRLKGVTDPERKRHIIGREFIRVFKQETGSLGDIRYLAQGTIYSDVIESGSLPSSHAIKSHHNVGGLPRKMGFKLVEPVRELFKDEVRMVGRKLGLPEEIISRQPFPGPGLAVRIVGEVTEAKLSVLKKAENILQKELDHHTRFKRDLWQFFAVHTGIDSVGLRDGKRTLGTALAIRAVSSEDGMTADWVLPPQELLNTITTRIYREMPEVSRVMLDITSKPPATIEWE